jgi:hypothetical protein
LVVPRGIEPLTSANQADTFPVTPWNQNFITPIITFVRFAVSPE